MRSLTQSITQKRPLSETDHAGTLVSDFWPLELGEKSSVVYKPPYLWYFVKVDQTKTILIAHSCC